MFAEPSHQNRLKLLSKFFNLFLKFYLLKLLLVEEHIEDEILGCLQFVNNYRDRYGHGPNFFEGSLFDALNTACGAKSARDVMLNTINLSRKR
jgi:hypothetical protein